MPSFPPFRPRSNEYKVLHKIADAQRPLVQASLTAGIGRMKKRLDTGALLQAINDNDIPKIQSLVPVDFVAADLAALERVSEQGIDKGGQAAKRFFERRLIPVIGAESVVVPFTIDNPRVKNFIRTRSAELLTDFGVSSKKAVVSIVERSFREGIPPSSQVSLIKRVVGLNERQAVAMMNFSLKLDLQGVTDTAKKKLLTAFEKRSVRFRAQMIARTETMRAVNLGQLEVWDQAADAGLIDRNETRKVWIVTFDDRLCPICRPLEGAMTNMDGLFETSVGFVEAPPAHPMCRCSVGLAFKGESLRSAA